MSVLKRNNVRVGGAGSATMVFAHGFGCDQNIWRLLMPHFEDRYRTVVFDLVGSGASDLTAYDRAKYTSLHGYADDLNQIIDELAPGPVIHVGHSVSAMIGMLADVKAPGRIAAQVMLAPSPRYIDDTDYVGGFAREDIDALLQVIESNYLGWSSNMAPSIMGAPGQPELGVELTNSFCRTDPEVAKHFARVIFTCDHRNDLAALKTPTLILQCSEDFIAPRVVGDYMHRTLPRSTLQVIDNTGHCPHLSAPDASRSAIDDFLRGMEL